ncbi:hypothetical protein K504DRAFT_378339 [Pleomassaria siparia CBS 279.74]|uniref:Uncharacterized protein n=1 Tax=Pleomassaria siparia CBS 279.74 TaxID=1314801 RepID=A0A6G1KC38_9PLEO|nr:hypothetical protein K504DRAFT_378339 [Pleomassaria siparia CBS 279.74]
MNGENPLRRSSWKAEAIRKGNLKISGPMPITEETPLNEEEERQYAEKHNAEPLDAPPLPAQPHLLSPIIREASQRASHPVETGLQQEHDARPKTPSNEPRIITETQQTSEQPSHSTPSPFPSIPESTSKTPPKKQKRKSGLRNVFRKMFSKRGRDESRDDEDTSRRGHEHHISDPGFSANSPDGAKETTGASRISTLPVRELAPLNPLGQHLPFPMNVNAPQESSPPHEYLTFDRPAADLGRRRATLPSVLHVNPETQLLPDATPLAPLEERDGNPPSPQIGMAISSPGQSFSIQSKRRSRSAGALRELAKSRTSTERRRSAEIRYWRQSYQSGSVYSTNTPRPRTAQTVETIQTEDTPDYASGAAPRSIADSSIVHAPTVDQHDQDISQIVLPVEAFNFGNLKSGFDEEDAEGELPTEGIRSESRLSMVERVQHLEEDLRTIEASVHRMSGHTDRQTIILDDAPKGRRSRDRSSSGSVGQTSHHSSRSSNVTPSQSGRHSPSAPPSPLSASSPRPTTLYRSELASQFAAIYEALKHERFARKNLQKQVVSLQREISDLHAIVNKQHTQSPSYPTPSPDAVIHSSEERLSTPRATARPDVHFGKFAIRETVLGRFEGDVRRNRYGAESGSEWSSKEDITSPEAWATPKEEFGGFFGKSRSRIDLKDGEDEMF